MRKLEELEAGGERGEASCSIGQRLSRSKVGYSVWRERNSCGKGSWLSGRVGWVVGKGRRVKAVI